MTVERCEYAIVDMEDITLRKRLHIYILAYEKNIDNNFKKHALLSNETFII